MHARCCQCCLAVARGREPLSRSPDEQVLRSERCMNDLIAAEHLCQNQQGERGAMDDSMNSGLTCHHGRQTRQTVLSPHPRSCLSGLYVHPPWTVSTPAQGSKAELTPQAADALVIAVIYLSEDFWLMLQVKDLPPSRWTLADYALREGCHSANKENPFSDPYWRSGFVPKLCEPAQSQTGFTCIEAPP